MASTPHIALVTGGMGGLGEAICIKMAALGYRVVTTHSPSNTHAAEGDVADFDSCARAVAEVQKKLGPVDVLVNNAGITRDMTFKTMTKTDWDAVMHTNLDSVFNVTMPSTTCFVMLKHESRLVFITASQFALSIFLNVMSRVMPALLTRTSIGPFSAATLASAFWHES